MYDGIVSHIISTAENEHVFLFLNSYPLFTALSIVNPIYKIWKFFFTYMCAMVFILAITANSTNACVLRMFWRASAFSCWF